MPVSLWSAHMEPTGSVDGLCRAPLETKGNQIPDGGTITDNLRVGEKSASKLLNCEHKPVNPLQSVCQRPALLTPFTSLISHI